MVAAFRPDGPVAAEAAQSMTVSNAKQVALAITMYEQDYDEHFPNADSTAKAQAAVHPYLKNDEVWASRNPNGGRLLYNASLSKRSLAQIDVTASTLLVWDEKPWPDGSRVVAYVDGHVKVATRDDWDRIWKAELRRRGK